jgi:hypothetical protein
MENENQIKKLDLDIVISTQELVKNTLQMPLTPSQIMELTNHVNIYRTKHRSSKIEWDNEIAKFSQTWSDFLLASNSFQKSTNKNYGENLYYYVGGLRDMITLLKNSINSWYQEGEMYDYSKPGYYDETNNFTTLVWKSCSTYGMGISTNLVTGITIIVYNCSPPSNVTGQFPKNVLPQLIIHQLNLPTLLNNVATLYNPLCSSAGILGYLQNVKDTMISGQNSKRKDIIVLNKINYLIEQLANDLVET